MADNEKRRAYSKRALKNVVSQSTIPVVFLLVMLVAYIVIYLTRATGIPVKSLVEKRPGVWMAPDTSTIANEANKDAIRYGQKLISNTAYYLGPKGTVDSISNGMNCQNCHLDAGTKPFGNNYGAVAATYPKFRARSGSVEDIYKRVNDCFIRSLNGKALDTTTKEMQAIVAYIKWVGKNVPKGESPNGAGLTELAYMSRAANPENGKKSYLQKCISCHLQTGEGKLNADGITYLYPPLWGEHSYNTGAGLYRLSRFAGYIKSNMPLGAVYNHPLLTDEEAWDIAAFVNSQLRPAIDLSKDWPDVAAKPVDFPFGPYADTFNEAQHKYGPFESMNRKLNKNF